MDLTPIKYEATIEMFVAVFIDVVYKLKRPRPER